MGSSPVVTPGSGGGSDSFRTTCWSMVLAAGGAGEPAREALDRLSQRYWYPVYAYLRRAGHEPEAAQRVAAGFFGSLDTGSLTDRPRQFRTFLLDALLEYLARRTGESGEPRSMPPPLDIEALEERLAADPGRGTPEQVYQHGFAREFLVAAWERLRAEAVAAGRGTMFDELEPFLTRDPDAARCEKLAKHLQLRPLSLVVALKRLRQRFRELVERELIETVDSPEALERERERLRSTLDG